jgi:hypothetical protein
LRLLERASELREPVGNLLFLGRAQESIERMFRHEQAEKQPEQSIETGCSNRLYGRSVVSGRAAHARRDGAHVATPRVQPLETLPHLDGKVVEHAHEGKLFRQGRDLHGDPTCAMYLGIDGGTKARDRNEARQVDELSGRHQRKQHLGDRRQRGGRPAAQKYQQIPSEKEGLTQIGNEPAR